MSLETARFPNRELLPGELKSIYELTGEPKPVRQDVIRLLRTAQEMMRGNNHIQYHLKTSMARVVAETNSDESSKRIFLSGALFYCAVAQIFGEVTLTDDGIRLVAQTEAEELLYTAPERLKTEASGFTEALERIIPVLDCGNIPRELVLVGAGATHMAVTHSIASIDRGPEICPTLPPELLDYENDPDLARFSDQVKDLGRPF